MFIVPDGFTLKCIAEPCAAGDEAPFACNKPLSQRRVEPPLVMDPVDGRGIPSPKSRTETRLVDKVVLMSQVL